MEADHAGHAGASSGPADLLSSIIHGEWYMPHGHCYLWRTDLVSLHVASDFLIGTAYVLISLVLYALVKRIKLPFSGMVAAFGVFIGACGLTHYMEVWNVWNSAYWLAGWIKGITAVASVLTGVYLVKVRPTIVELADSARLSNERRLELEAKNRELESLYARVRAVDELKTQFFSNVSHELRTPLALILGPVERLLSDGALAPAQREDLTVVQRNARTLLRQVNALLDTAKLESGRVELRYAAFDLGELVRVCGANFEALARSRRLTFEVEGGPLTVAADEEKVERVLVNLLSNAFKFTPEGGRIRCAWTEREGTAQVSVEDSGPGIPPEARELVFERFRQASAGSARAFGGTGLGLSIARELTVLHGGRLAVDASPLGGARFVLELPVSAPAGAEVKGEALPPAALAAEAQAAVAELAAQAPGGEPRAAPPNSPLVLVVDDSPELREFLRRTLAAEFRVETAEHGREGLTKAEALRPDVIVSDVMMPVMSGDELLRELRARPELSAIPIILLTARAEDPLRIELLGAGAQDYLVKPFVAAELLARVRNMASMKRTREVLERALAASSSDVAELAEALARRQRELQAALETTRSARAMAEKASETKTTLLRLVSHELRTPLSVLHLNVHALAQTIDAADKDQEKVARMSRALTRLQTTVDTVLEYTRLEAGYLSPQNEEVELAAIVRELVDELRPDAQRKLLELDARLPAGGLSVRTDSRLLKLVLLNLLSNAVKYTDRGSITIGVEPFDSGARISVRDTGRGIPAEEQERIFEPFAQVEPLRHKTTPGLGLGLALVRAIVAALGGTIALQSTVGEGSTFLVVLPAAAEARPSAQPGG